MRIIDWSSDVCSSDLARVVAAVNALRLPHQFVEWQVEQFRDFLARPVGAGVRHPIASSACARSAMMSSICSIPTDTRTTSGDRKSVVTGKGVSVRVDLGGRRSIQKKTYKDSDEKNN